MRFLSRYFFGQKSPRPTPASVQGDGIVAPLAPQQPPVALSLPPRRTDVEDWVPPIARSVAAEMHANALVAMFQQEGKTGPTPHWLIMRRYPEFCWERGFYELSEREILQAIGRICAKVRIDRMDRGDRVLARVTCYVIPAPTWVVKQPAGGNVVAIGADRRFVWNAKVAAKKTASRRTRGHRADIGEAVACQC